MPRDSVQPALEPRLVSVTTAVAVGILVSGYLLAFRVYDLSSSYALLAEQIRDWSVAQRQFTELPLIGPRSGNSGLDIGPVYYWVLWAGRHLSTPVLGPLPHVGGYTPALLQAIGDGVLLVALARTLGSWWLASGIVVLAATSPLDASLSALTWNPPIAEAFVKLATAALLWPGAPSSWRSTVTLLLSIAAVQCHPTAIFVAAPVALASLLHLARYRGAQSTRIPLLVGVLALAAWASTYAIQPDVPSPSMAGSLPVEGSVVAAWTDPAGRLRPLASADSVGAALDYLYLDPFGGSWLRWVLLASALLTIACVRQPRLWAAAVAPPLAAVAAFSLWQGAGAEFYWFMTIMPATAISIAAPLSALPGRLRSVATTAFIALVIALQPARAQQTWTAYRKPSYGPLARGVTAAAPGRAVREIRTTFAVPAGMDPAFMFSLVGGKLDDDAADALLVEGDGRIRYVPLVKPGL